MKRLGGKYRALREQKGQRRANSFPISKLEHLSSPALV
jgi:hypothetical protein